MSATEKKCPACDEVLPLTAFGHEGRRDCKDCRKLHRRMRAHGTPGCDVWQVVAHGSCYMAAVVPFAAVCACGHRIEGGACQGCLQAAVLGCLTCWTESQHRCTVKFLEPARAAS